METMKDRFGLKEGHNDFAIETDDNAKLFFARQDLEEQLQSMLRRSFRTTNPPKLVLYGDWGVGKTHTMRHMEFVIETNDDYPAKVIFKELPDISKKSTFQVAHAALLDALGFDTAIAWIRAFQIADQDYATKIHDWTQSGDIRNAFETLLLGRGDASRSAWDWLRGISISAADTRGAGLGPALSESKQFVQVLRVFGQLCKLANNEMLIFMLDEATKLSSVQDQDSINHWLNAFKDIADQQTKEIGLIVSISCHDIDEMAVPLQDQQVQTRFGESHYVALQTMDEHQTEEFLRNLLAEWSDEEKRKQLIADHGQEADGENVEDNTFPFTKDGLDIAVQFACRNGSMSRPRDIQQTLDDLLNRAIDDGQHILPSSYVQSLING